MMSDLKFFTDYEIALLVRPDLSIKDIDAFMSLFVSCLQSNHSDIHTAEYWGTRPMSYKIKRYNNAHYFYFKASIPRSFISDLKAFLSIKDQVIRYMVLNISSEDTKKPSYMHANVQNEINHFEGAMNYEKALEGLTSISKFFVKQQNEIKPYQSSSY